MYIYYTNHMNPYDALGFSEIMGFILQQKAIAIRISSDFSGFHHDDDFLGCRTSSHRPMSSLLFVSKIDQSEGLPRHY